MKTEYKNWRQKDPNMQRESGKYGSPVPSREYIKDYLESAGAPRSFKKILKAFAIDQEDQVEPMKRRLAAMVRDGQLVRNRIEGYAPISKLDLISGQVSGHRDGFGFLIPADGGEDIYLPAHQMKRMLHGDRVLVRIKGLNRRGRLEGDVVEVVEPANQEVVGEFVNEAGVFLVRPDNQRISQDVIIPAAHIGGAQHGQLVVAQIVEQPSRRTPPIGHIKEILGEQMAPGMEIDVAIRSHGLPHVWSEDALQQAASYGSEVPQAMIEKCEDLRHLPLVTIDGADARDFDDAVFCEPQGKGWRLLVAIADVSAYVGIGSTLDQEAAERGTSVYFPEKVVPMLPEALSNGLCSLNPDVDRLCMVCELSISENGKPGKSRFFEGVMRSKARLTYDQMAAIVVERNVSQRRDREDLVGHLDELYKLYKAMARARQRRGTIEFDTTETQIVFGENRKIHEIRPVVRNDAHRLIEECMIAANIAAARFVEKHKIPGLYRVHQSPSEKKLNELREFLMPRGLSLGGGESPGPEHYHSLLEQLRDRPDRHLLETVLLRSLSQAVYSPDNQGHFGLALEKYAHFTSPIRRYPDLLIHRAIKHIVRGGNVADYTYAMDKMRALGERCSTLERRADEATRDVIDWLKCEYMQDKVGQEFQGIITTVTGFGLFVELNGIYVEGLVHITALGKDYFHYDQTRQCLAGERSGRVFALADTICVQVARVNLDDRKIDFELAGEEATNTRKIGEKAHKAKSSSKRNDKKNKKRDSGAKRKRVKKQKK